MSYRHSSCQPQHSQHSFIKTLPTTEHAASLGHTRILSRFSLPSLSPSATGITGRMQFKITRASAAVHGGANNKPKTIPHQSLYDDPAFSADPSSNPLCSASHDITPWVIDPPKGHPAIRSPQTHRTTHSNHEIILIQPPNSPAPLHAQPKPQQQVSMRNPAVSPSMSPSPPDLSAGTSSASEASLQTPGTSRSFPIKSHTDIPFVPPSEDGKKRLGLSFFKRKSNNAEGVAQKPHKDMPLGANSKDSKSNSHSHSFVNGSDEAMNGTTNGIKPGVVKGQFAPVKSRELDMIDELDESNPLGISLHHRGPYEAIQRVVGPNTYLPRVSRQSHHPPPPVQDQPFRLDVPLNLSPGQILPHSVTSYYRPRAHLTPANDVRDRLGLHVPAFRDYPAGQAPPPPANRNAGMVMIHPTVDNSATSLASSQASYSTPPPYVALESSHRYGAPEQIHPISRAQTPDPQLASQQGHRVLPPSDQTDHSATAILEAEGTGDGTHDADGEPDDETRITEQGVAVGNNSEAVQQSTASGADHSYLPYAGRETLAPPHGPSRNTPSPRPSCTWYPAPRDPYGRQEPPQGPVHDRRLYEIRSSAPSSSSSLHSGASSGSNTGNSAPPTLTRNRILPKQLIMPAPLAKAAVSSRPKPTQMLQSLQQWQDMRGQHRIRFHDGTEYELPVMTSNQTIERPASMQALPANIVKPHTRANSIVHGGKLRKHTSLRGPEPPEIVARLAAAPRVVQRRKYMEPPPTVPEAPRVDRGMPKDQGKDVKRFLTKRRSLL